MFKHCNVWTFIYLQQKQQIQKSEHSEVVAGPSMHLRPAGGKSWNRDLKLALWIGKLEGTDLIRLKSTGNIIGSKTFKFYGGTLTN